MVFLSSTAAAQNVGIGTSKPKARLHVTDSSVVFSATGIAPANPSNPPISGEGRRMMWYADKGAFRVGYASGDNWDKAQVGNYSFAAGFGSAASGDYSVAIGLNNKAVGLNSLAFGWNSIAKSDYSTAIGTGSFANGISSTAIGILNVANGGYAAAFGYNNISNAFGGTVVGMFNDATDQPNPNQMAPSDRIFQIGNGYYDYISDDNIRHNALTVLRSGNVGIGTTIPGHTLTIEQPGGGRYNEGFEWLGSALAIRSGTNIGTDYALVLGTDTSHKTSYIQSYGYGMGGKSLIINGIGGNVGIGTDKPLAALDVSSTTQGFLPPRMTIAERNAIAIPSVGLVIFCTECDELEVYNGTIWKAMTGTAACILPTFPGVTICNQVWMQKNLDVSKYRNGDDIPQVTDPVAWASLTTGAWCWYNNDSANYASTYGKLYNWFAVKDIRVLAPQGWHVSSDGEWAATSTCLGNLPVAGGKMKQTGTLHWLSPNTGASNSSGFEALPGGSRDNNGIFQNLGQYGCFWSTFNGPNTTSLYRFLYNLSSDLSSNIYIDKHSGFSVRCVKD
ncbi:hypothetical protein BH10BAC3_BH10BAC3_39660 [soil metagenome]